MPTARLMATDPPEYVHAEEIPVRGKQWKDQMLRCHYCDASIETVNPMPKENSRRCRPHFRRRRKVKGSGDNLHGSDCPYGVPTRIQVLVDGSGDALVRERRRSGPLRYRLVVPEAFGPAVSPGRGEGAQVVAERLTTVLNTAAKIAALIEDYTARGVDPNIEWYAECRGERVEWLNFLYTPQRAWALARRLNAGGPLSHPVAVLFAPYTPKVPWSDRIRFWRRSGDAFRAAAYPVPSDTEQRMAAQLVVAGEQQLMESVFTAEPGRFYLGYGIWELDMHTRDTLPRLTLRMDNVGQVAPVPDDIGAAAVSRWRFPGRAQS